MTKAQSKGLYWPRWNRCWKANWRSVEGLVVPNPDRVLCAELTAVESAAHQLAVADHRAVCVDDLRKGCHVVAVGRPRSSKALTNAELTRVVSLFNLLAEPEDLSAVVAWQHPEIEARKRVVTLIERVPEAYVRAVSRTSDWRDLPERDLLNLLRTLRNRPNSGLHRSPKPAPAPVANDDNPF